MEIRLIPTSMTLNDLERHNSPILIFWPNSIALLANYVKVGEDRLCPQNIVFQFQSSTFGKTNPPCSAVSLR